MIAGTPAAPSRFLVLAAFAAIYLIWGSTYLAIRYAVETVPPFFAAGSRFMVAGSILYAWARMRGTERPTGVHWRSAAVIGCLMLGGGGGAVHWAEQFVPSSVTVLLITTVPVWMVLLHWFQRDGKAPTVAEIGGVVLGFGGVLLLVGAGDLGGGQPVDRLAAVVLVLASLSWAFGSVYSSRLKLPDSPLLAPSMEMLCGGALLLALGLARGEATSIEIGAVTGKSILAFVYLVVLGSIVGFTAYVWLLRVSTPARVSTYAFANPVVAVLLGCTLGGEPFTSRFLLSALIIILAVVLITTGRRREGRDVDSVTRAAEAVRRDVEPRAPVPAPALAGRTRDEEPGCVAACE